MKNKDTDLIFEAYKKRLNESVEDKNYVPTLEEIKEWLRNHYDNRYYMNSSMRDIRQKKLDELDETASKVLETIIDAKEQADTHNHKYAKPDGSDAYTVWDILYSTVSDDSKDLNGFRHRTNFKETPTIPMALYLNEIHDRLRSQREERDLDWAGSEEGDSYDNDVEQLEYTINDDGKVSKAIQSNIDKGDISLKKALTSIIDSYKDKGGKYTHQSAKLGVLHIVRDAIEHYTREKDFEKADTLKAVMPDLQ